MNADGIQNKTQCTTAGGAKLKLIKITSKTTTRGWGWLWFMHGFDLYFWGIFWVYNANTSRIDYAQVQYTKNT